MHGIVLAAGGGTRLRPLTDELPKTLLDVGGRSILDLAVANLAHAGVDAITIVTGHAADTIAARLAALEARHDLPIHLRHNDRYDDRNNAYSLWLVRDLFAAGVLLVNGDTVHPPEVEARLLAALDGERDGVVLAMDDAKGLAEEEMKLEVDAAGDVRHITKQMAPGQAAGEYIGVAWIAPGAADGLAEALRAAWESDPQTYYEDGFQVLADRGGRVRAVPITPASWVEVDDHDDLAAARRVVAGW